MQKLIRFRLMLLLVGALTIVSACQKDSFTVNGVKPAYGPSVKLGDGTARAWIVVDDNGDPTAVGVNLSDDALVSLPDEGQGFVLSLPEDKGHNFYTHVLLDWNPHGHEPAGVYDSPHFDVHFYTIPNADRLEIMLVNPPALDSAPAAKYQPPVYLETPGVVPAMGAHWVDLQSPEFNGGAFAKTFIWGSYNQEFIFWEPMVTLAYLQTMPDAVSALRQPEAYQKDGWYAQNYRVAYVAASKEYTISLMDLKFHAGE